MFSQVKAKSKIRALRCIKGNVGPFVFGDVYHGILSLRPNLTQGVWVWVESDRQWQEHAASLFEPCDPQSRYLFAHLVLKDRSRPWQLLTNIQAAA